MGTLENFDKVYSNVSELPRGCHPKHGVVYAVIIGDKVKIGATIKPKGRIASMQTMGGRKAEAVYVSLQGTNYREIEAKLHKLLSRYRVIGEWFNCTFDLAVYAIQQEKFVRDQSAIDAEIEELRYWVDRFDERCLKHLRQ